MMHYGLYNKQKIRLIHRIIKFPQLFKLKQRILLGRSQEVSKLSVLSESSLFWNNSCMLLNSKLPIALWRAVVCRGSNEHQRLYIIFWGTVSFSDTVCLIGLRSSNQRR